ncbi:TRAM domain-containing protein, partial [Palleronia rufa]
VEEPVKDDRLRRLQALLRDQQHAVQRRMVGQEVGVLFDKPGREPGQMVGKSDHLHSVFVFVAGDGVARGDLRRVRITASAPNSLAGTLV